MFIRVNRFSRRTVYVDRTIRIACSPSVFCVDGFSPPSLLLFIHPYYHYYYYFLNTGQRMTHRTGMTPTESPLLDYDYLSTGLGSAPYSALNGLLGNPTSSGSAMAMMNSDEFHNIFLSPRSATPHCRRSASATNSAMVKNGTSVGNLGIGNTEDVYENMHSYTNDMHHAMHLHYNTDYQPHNTIHTSHNTATRESEDLHDRYIVGAQSPERNNNNLSVLAETSIASAEKEKHHLRYTSATSTTHTNHSHSSHGMDANSSTSRTIYAEDSLAVDTSELSRIVKAEDSPLSQAQDNSFSFADISMSTPFERPRMALDSVLSPITHKSPDVSMTPYMTLLTLDNSSCSEGSNPASEERSMHAIHTNGHTNTTNGANQSTVDVSMLDTTTNRSLFGTSTKRKRQQSSEENDHTQVYTHQPARFVSISLLSVWLCDFSIVYAALTFWWYFHTSLLMIRILLQRGARYPHSLWRPPPYQHHC